jgi:hypothetical protein
MSTLTVPASGRPRINVTLTLPSAQTLWMAVLTALVAWQTFFRASGATPPPPSSPTFDAVAAGRAYGGDLAHTYADALNAAAQAIRGGGSLAEAQTKLKADWAAAYTKAFAARCGAALVAIVPEGQEPSTPAQRQAFAALLEQIARGAKEVR